VDEGRDALVILVTPDLTHEGSVEIRLTAEERIDGWVAQELGENDDLSGSVEDCA
jgi:hypothetical protein